MEKSKEKNKPISMQNEDRNIILVGNPFDKDND
jgi:hypothetical protein